MATSRRDFLKNSGLTFGALAATSMLPWPFRKLSTAEAAEIADYAGGKWVPSCCNMCGGQCGVLAFVSGGAVRKIEPNGANPNNVANVSTAFDAARTAGDQGRLCCKGNSAIRSLYDPDRLRTPLQRVGPRGSGDFVAISWEQAISEVATRLAAIKSSYGASSIVWFGEDHSFTHIQQDICDALGTPNYSNHSNLCDTSRKAHYVSTMGHDRPLADMEGTDLLFVWGWNFLSALKWVHLAAIFTRARMKNPNFQFIYVDPVFNTTASKADTWVAPRPGTDGAVALAIAKELLDYDALSATEKINRSWVAQWTVGLTNFKKYLDGDGTYDSVAKDAAWGEARSGVPAATIKGIARQLGDAYAAGRRICIDTWSGPGHHTNATQGGRAINALALMLGAVDVEGGLLFPLRNGPSRLPGDSAWPSKSRWRFDGRDDVTIPASAASAITSNRALVDSTGAALSAGTDLRGKTFHKKYQMSHGSGIYCEGRDVMLNQRDFLGIEYPTKAAVFVFQNFVMSTPNTQKNIDAINKMEFVLSVDSHLSETAMLADIVIPGSHYLERFDFNANWVSFRSLGMRQPVIPSWIGGRSEAQFFMDVGAAMGLAGFNAASFRDVDFNLNKKEWEGFVKDYENKMTWDQLLAAGVWIETGKKGGTQYRKYTGKFSLGSYNSKWMHLEGTSGAYQIRSGTTNPGGVLIGTSSATSALKDGAAFTLDAAFSAGGFQASLMHVEAVTIGGDVRYHVRSGTAAGSGEVLGIGPGDGSTPADGTAFPAGFATETKFAQFWSKNLDNVWKASPSKYPNGANLSQDPRYHPLPFYLPPEDGPNATYPLHFVSWKEVEHTHSRTFNNEWLMELKGENKLLIHPLAASASGVKESDWVWVESPHGRLRIRAHITEGIQPETVGFVRGFGHWALGKVAKGKGAHDGWLLSGKAEIHSGQAVHKEVPCRIYRDQ